MDTELKEMLARIITLLEEIRTTTKDTASFACHTEGHAESILDHLQKEG